MYPGVSSEFTPQGIPGHLCITGGEIEIIQLSQGGNMALSGLPCVLVFFKVKGDYFRFWFPAYSDEDLPSIF